MIGNIFKNIGKGIGYFFLFPGLLIAIAIYAVFGLIVFIYQFFKLIFLFFTGRTLFSDLPEDIKVKAILDDKVNGGSEKSEEAPAQPKSQEESQSSTQTAPVYTSLRHYILKQMLNQKINQPQILNLNQLKKK